MQVRLSDDALVGDLMAHFRARGYLVTSDGSVVSAIPINAVSERGDRERFRRDLALWQSEHPSVLTAVSTG